MFELKLNKIQARREAMAISREAMAKASGLSASLISMIESGKKKDVNASTIGKLAAAMNVTPDYFFQRLGGDK